MKLSFLLPVILFASCYTQGPTRVQRANPNLPPSEPGKCYAKCQTAGETILTDKAYPVYTGNDVNSVTIIDTTFNIKGGKTWVKKKSPTPCRSADPNDCLVWCLVDVPARSVTKQILSDVRQTTDYEMTRLVLGTRENGTTEWKEVVCANKINSLLIYQICEKLQIDGYTTLNCKGVELSKELKDAIISYQKDNFLPIGNLDMETLDHMGVKV